MAVYTAELVAGDDADFCRLKNDLVNAVQTQSDIKSAAAALLYTFLFTVCNNLVLLTRAMPFVDTAGSP